MLTHLDLCSGIGGFSLASGWAGYTTIGFCEIDPFCQRVLRKHWPEVPIHDDLRTLDGRTVRDWLSTSLDDTEGERRANGADGSHAGSSVRNVDPPASASVQRGARLSLFTAGYPCQPFSQAGKRLGEEDDRHLWPAIAALVAELKPDQCLFENVAGHITLGLDRVLADLEEIGYACGTVVVPACAVNAPHRRDRVWIMAHRTSDGRRQGHENNGRSPAGIQPRPKRGLERSSEVVSDSQVSRRRAQPGQANGFAEPRTRKALSGVGDGHDGLSPWLVGFGLDWEHGIPRVTEYESERVNKLKSLGNSIVPQVAYEIITAMRVAA